MKISHLIIVILVAGLGAAGIKYTLDQRDIMDAVIAAHGGGPLVEDMDAGGLRKARTEIDTQAATAATERADAVKASDSARLEMIDSLNKRQDSQNQLDRDKAELEDWQGKVKRALDRVEQIKAEFQAAVAELQNVPDLGEETELATAMEKLKTVVEQERERNKELIADHADKVTVREALTEKVAKEDAEHKHIKGINDKFFENYTKNKDEFEVLAVNTRWNFVVFNVGKESGLVAGDSTPLLAKRGDTLLANLRIVSITGDQVIAEYDPAQIPAGLRIEVGDRVFRQKPLGN